MRLVVDANVLISALIRDGKSREIILSDVFELVCPEYLGDEIYRHREYIARKSGLTPDEVSLLFNLLLRRIKSVPEISYKDEWEQDGTIIKSDPDDVPYVACFLALKCDGIWTNDTHFSEGRGLIVYKTDALLRMMKDR